MDRSTFFENNLNNSEDKFPDRDYISIKGVLDEDRLIGVNHICIHDDCTILNDLVLPFGAQDIEEKTTYILEDILDVIVPIIQKKENREKIITICGPALARRMLGRKLEDRIKKEIDY